MNGDAGRRGHDKVTAMAAAAGARRCGTDAGPGGEGQPSAAPQVELDSFEALRTWAERYADRFWLNQFRGISVLDVLAGPPICPGMLTRADADNGPGDWIAFLARGLQSMRDRGILRPESDPNAMASSLIAMLLGGIILAKAREDVVPLRTAITVMMAHIRSFEEAGNGT